jgi:hypothetical protein
MARVERANLYDCGFSRALAPVEKNLLNATSLGASTAASMEETLPTKLVCSDGHDLSCFSPQVDGFYCEECYIDLEEGKSCLRCIDCGGLTYCYECIRQPHRAREDDLNLALAECLRQPQRAREDDLDLALALSLSEVDELDVVLALSSQGNATNLKVIRCFVCGVKTKSPLSLDDPECLHHACSLACLHRLHTQWLDIKQELRDMDAALH